jgi:hypothetical protein
MAQPSANGTIQYRTRSAAIRFLHARRASSGAAAAAVPTRENTAYIKCVRLWQYGTIAAAD